MIEIKNLIISILEHLRGEIMTFQLKGGERLNENELSLRLQVSRPPLREAFQVLEQEHLLVSIPRRGRFVAQIDEKNCAKIYEARRAIEFYVIDTLKTEDVRNLPEVDMALAEVLKKTMPPQDPYEKLRYIEALDEFHIKLVDSVKNEFLTHFYGTIRFNISRYQYWLRVLCLPHLLSPQSAETLIQDHFRVSDLIKRGEYDDAKECLRAHIDNALTLMKENLQRKGPSINEVSGPIRNSYGRNFSVRAAENFYFSRERMRGDEK